MTLETPDRRLFLARASRAATALGLVSLIPHLRAESAPPAATEGGTISLAFDAAHGALLKASVESVLRSDDGGHRWSRLALPPSAVPRRIHSVAVAAGSSSIFVAGTGIGVLRSDDQGRTWSPRNDGLQSPDVAALAAHADRPETVYAYLRAKGIFRSEDGGRRWRLMDAGPRGGVSSFFHSNMPGSMQSGWLFVAGPDGVRRSMDCFCGWRDAGGLGRAVSAVAYDPGAPADVYAATPGGLFFSKDGGEQWSPLGAPATFEALVVTPRREIFAAGSDGKLYLRESGATSWRRVDA
ncbi:MAG: hypothetical protein M3Y67_00720 [Pseudomonadota bacterium]|nr:hypothetical protein [Pseudomonadota bacterium]